MKLPTKILLGTGVLLVLSCIAGVGIVWFFRHDFLEVMGPSKPCPIGVVGTPMDPRTQESYDFATKTSGLSFPQGTIVDTFDQGNYTVSCMTLPPNKTDAFLKANPIQLHSLSGAPLFRGMQHLRVENQQIPPTGVEMGMLPSAPWRERVQLYVHRATSKCWLVIYCDDWTGQPPPEPQPQPQPQPQTPAPDTSNRRALIHHYSLPHHL